MVFRRLLLVLAAVLLFNGTALSDIAQRSVCNGSSLTAYEACSNDILEYETTIVWTRVRLFVLYFVDWGYLYLKANLTDFQGNPVANESVYFGFRENVRPELPTDGYVPLGIQTTNDLGIAKYVIGLWVPPMPYTIKCWHEQNSNFSASEDRVNVFIPEREETALHIRSDGSVDPPDAPLQRRGSTYTLTGDITAKSCGVKIERGDIVFDGVGHTIQPSPHCVGSYGIDLNSMTNVTIRNVCIKDFTLNIDLSYSANNNLTRNTLFGSIEQDAGWEIGIDLIGVSNNTICQNDIVRMSWGMLFQSSSNNTIYNNNFLWNTHVQENGRDSVNVWDNGYPCGGNYWSEYNGTDSHSGPYQNETGSDGILDSPCIIDLNNTDNYPLAYPWSPPAIVTFDVFPSRLNLESNNKWTIGVIKLPIGFRPIDVNVSSVLITEQPQWICLS